MPVWHESTKSLRDAGKLRVVGLIQEQHPQRCKLFMQWQRLDFPVLADPLNLLEVTVVPIAVLLDEQGVVRQVLRRPDELADALTKLAAPVKPTDRAQQTKPLHRLNEYLWTDDQRRFWRALKFLGALVRKEPGNGAYRFARGVVYRMRFDSPLRQMEDFAAAAHDWEGALEQYPNQYIWRRRIQQYGPRLDKPYPFYNWITQARREIRGRGETPVALRTEPSGAEFAAPAPRFEAAATQPANPDPDARIERDLSPYILAEIAAVPRRLKPGSATRVHVVLRPNPRRDAHWNNETGPLVFWVDPPPGWRVTARRITLPAAPTAISSETRRVEFEVRVPDDADPTRTTISGFALYGVCEGEAGACLYRRMDLAVAVEVTR